MHVWCPERSDVTRSSGTGLQWLWATIQSLRTKPRSSAKPWAPNHSNPCSAPIQVSSNTKACTFPQNSEDLPKPQSPPQTCDWPLTHYLLFPKRLARSFFLGLPHRVPISGSSLVILTSQHLTICARNGSLNMRKHTVFICLSQAYFTFTMVSSSVHLLQLM